MMKPAILTATGLLAAAAFADAVAACASDDKRSWTQLEQDRSAAHAQGPLAEADVLFAQAVRKAADREPTYSAELGQQASDLWRAAPPTAELAAELQQKARKAGYAKCALAAPLLRTALAVAERAAGADAAQTTAILADLVRAESAAQDSKALAQDGARLMAAWAQHDEPADAEAAPLYRAMVDLYYRQQQYAQAEPLALRNLKNGEQAHGKEAAPLIGRLDDLAVIYYGQLRYAEGAALSQRARDIAIKAAPDSLRAMGKRKKDTEAEMRRLYNDGKPAAALALGGQELKRLEQTAASDAAALQTAIKEREAATSAKQMEELGAAAQRARSASEGSEQQLGAMRVRVAQLHHSQRRYDLAEPLYQQALLNYTQAQADPLDMALVRSDLAMLYRARGDDERAAPLQQQALDVLLPAYGAAHPDVVECARELVLLYQRNGKPDEASALLERVPAAARPR
jgi:hypothetical protein